MRVCVAFLRLQETVITLLRYTGFVQALQAVLVPLAHSFEVSDTAGTIGVAMNWSFWGQTADRTVLASGANHSRITVNIDKMSGQRIFSQHTEIK